MNLLVLVLWLGSEVVTTVIAQEIVVEDWMPLLPPPSDDPIEVEISRLLATCNIQPGSPGAECDRYRDGAGSDACYFACTKYVHAPPSCRNLTQRASFGSR